MNNPTTVPCSKVRLEWKADKNPAMQTYNQTWGNVVLLALVVCFLSGCQVTPYIRDVHEDERLMVRLEDHTGGPFPANPMQFDHPVELSEDQWGRTLRSIQIQREAGGDPAYGTGKELGESRKEQEALFSEHEIRRLQQYVAQAFAQARDSEWVTFVIRHPLGAYQWLKKTITAQSISSGGIYMADHTLHMYLANIRTPMTLPAIGDHIRDNPFSVTDAPFYQVNNTAIQTVKKLPQEGLRGTINPSIYEVTLDMAHIFQATEGMTPNSTSDGEPLRQPLRDEPRVAKKLRQLLKLQQDGLLTEEEYGVMKRKLLDQFIDASQSKTD